MRVSGFAPGFIAATLFALAGAPAPGRAAPAPAPAARPVSAPGPEPARLTLDNGTLQLEATPAFGGRVLSVRLHGRPNVLKVGEAVTRQPAPRVAADAGDIPYLGHDVWVGPQSAWWLHQRVNPARRQARAPWPPDPYLSLARTRMEANDGRSIGLQGVASPVTGVRLRKRLALSRARPDTVELAVEARNIRRSPVAWDLWFNTRVAADTRVFVPVAGAADVRLQASLEPGTAPPPYRREAGLFELSAGVAGGGPKRQGKVLLQPSAGWMAGFAGGQVLVIRFPHRPQALIHPEQGQVELYLDAPAATPAAGLLELEVHAPYRTLAPGEAMQATEQWTLLPYAGADTPQAQRRFLCAQAAALALAHACP